VAITHQTPMPIPGKLLHFPGPQVTWAGEFPWTHDLCFGTEDGSICVKDTNGVEISYSPIIDSGEAINGVAFSRNMVAISTRAELLVKRFSSSDESQTILHYQIGAHGIVSTGRGGFLAPIGAMGFLQIELRPDGSLQNRQFHGNEEDLYFYRIARLGITAEGDEIFACAGRNDGVISLEVGTNGLPNRVIINQSHNTINNELADIVDVCRLPSESHAFATASLGLDNSIHLSEDIRGGHRRLGLRFPEMQGTAYSVLSAQGHLFILTSEAFYFLPKLADQFLKGEPVEARITVHRIPLEALDCSIAYGEHLMLIIAKSVGLVEVSQLAAVSGAEDDSRPRRERVATSLKADEMVAVIDQFAWESPKEYPIESLISSVPTSSAAASVSFG
jgi:hypothetical protein